MKNKRPCIFIDIDKKNSKNSFVIIDNKDRVSDNRIENLIGIEVKSLHSFFDSLSNLNITSINLKSFDDSLQMIGLKVKRSSLFNNSCSVVIISVCKGRICVTVVRPESVKYYECSSGFLRGLNADAKNRWLEDTFGQLDVFEALYPSIPDMQEELEKRAEKIPGIGDTTIDETLGELHNYFSDIERSKRGKK